MKKLGLFIICFALIGSRTKVHGQGISLNGIPQDEAIKMFNFYQQNRGQDTQPTRQSVWIKGEDLKNIIDLLKKEKKEDPDQVHSTDGVRIYFASKIGYGNGSLNTTIIMMPTKYLRDTIINTVTVGLHHDYFKHAPADSTMLASIKDKIYKKHRYYRQGEGLYDPCTNCDVPCPIPNPNPHYIDRKQAEEMVKNFGNEAMKTNSEWFDLRLLDELANDNRYDGMRLYFAKHGPNDPDVKGQIVKDKEALIWVPTVRVPKLLFFYEHQDRFDCDAAKNYMLKFFNAVSPGGQDNGELCPSNCDPDPLPPAR
jgi:hypothetical protein